MIAIMWFKTLMHLYWLKATQILKFERILFLIL